MHAFRLSGFDIPGIGHAIIVPSAPPEGFPGIVPFDGEPPAEPIRLTQVHGGIVHSLRSESDAGSVHLSFGDGFVTDAPGVPVAIVTADCIPVILADKNAKVVSVIHGSWRSVAVGIPRNALAIIEVEMGIAPSELLCAMGPGILAGDYEVGADVAARFPDSVKPTGNGKYLLNLPGEIARRLIARGVSGDNILLPPASTFGEDWLPSYRKQGDKAGRITTVVWIE